MRFSREERQKRRLSQALKDVEVERLFICCVFWRGMQALPSLLGTCRKARLAS